MKGSEAVAKVLEAEGVEFLTGYPHNILFDSTSALGIRPIIARTERVAVNIADGFSRVSNGRRIGVTAVQYGPGAESGFGAVAQAFADGSPVLFLPSGYPSEEQGFAPNFVAPPSYAPVTKWAHTVNAVERIPLDLKRAFSQLRSGRRAPVVVEIPENLLEAEMSDDAFRYTPADDSLLAGDARDVSETVAALLAAKAPVIYAGQGIFYAEAWDELRAFAELVQVPVMTTLAGKSAFPENHPLALGTGGLSRPATVDHALAKADFVLGIGTSFTLSAYTSVVPAGKTMAQVTIEPDDVNKCYPISYGVIGDAKAVLGQMMAEARARLGNAGRGENGVAAEIKAVREAFMREWLPRLTSDEEPISPYRVIWDLMHTVDRTRTTVIHDSGNPRDQCVPFYEAIVPHGYIGWGKSTQLGTGLGLNMGAKLAQPDWLTVNVMGDGAFGMVGMDFETAVRLDIPILTVILNNGLMGGYEKNIPIATSRYNAHHLSGDYAKVGEALGGHAERVEKVADLKPALSRAIAAVEGGRAALLEVRTREEAVFPLGQ